MAKLRQRHDDRRCGACAADLAHCHATLVLHADGTLVCPQPEDCGGQPDLHEAWIPCTELMVPCGCIGDEDPATEDGHLARAA